MANSIEKLTDILVDSKNIVFLTGAGMSVAAGLPTFRGTSGLWNTSESMRWAHRESYDNNPTEWFVGFWRYYEKRQVLAPSIAHHALSGIVGKLGADVVTQNIDGFDLEAGVPPTKLYEIHGNDRHLYCTGCDYSVCTREWILNNPEQELPKCPNQHPLKPSILLFGKDSVPGLDLVREMAYARITEADTLIAVGTSLEIPYVADLALDFSDAKERLVIINPERTIADAAAQIVVRETAELALTNLHKNLEL
jgi:NAD-dependent deacetylase